MKIFSVCTLVLIIMLAACRAFAIQDDMRVPPDKPTEEVPREGCITDECHLETKDRAFLHGPLHVNACDGCHKLTSAKDHSFELVRESKKLCLFCHDLDLSGFEVIHEPLAEGECLPCHDPHGGSGPGLLRGDDYPDLCANCHDDVRAQSQSVHGPVAAGACGACHTPHGSLLPMLLNERGNDLCLPCHLSTKEQMESSTFMHDPAGHDCQLCHDPHASEHSMQLRKDPLELCGECHEAIQHTVETASVEHAAVTTRRSCLNCHASHASYHPRLLRDNVMNLCFECHNQEIVLEDGRVLANMKAIIETGKSLHGPIAQSNCTACHDIHGGGHTRLLRHEFPSEFYYPFKEDTYSLCFSCHDRQMVLEPNTKALTDFRNGEDNLHFVHVNKERRGRSCSVCHETHASDRERNIHDEIPYGGGGWILPIHFESLETGGRCAAGCHRAYEYNRIEPLTYPTTEVDDAWKGGDLPDPDDRDSRNEPDDEEKVVVQLPLLERHEMPEGAAQ